MKIFKCDACSATVSNEGVARRRVIDLRSIDGAMFEIRAMGESGKYDLLCDDCWPSQLRKIAKKLMKDLNDE